MATATFDPATAAVSLEVLSGEWPGATPAAVSITRRPMGGVEAPVRGWTGRTIVAGAVFAVDAEMPLGTQVVYTVVGLDTAGATVGTRTATATTTGAAEGLWLKAPGRPDLTVRADVAHRGVGDRVSPTVGGVYRILGGPQLAVAQFGGVGAWSREVAIQALDMPTARVVGALLDSHRIVLVQYVGPDDLESGWVMLGDVSESPLVNVYGSGDGRRWELPMTSVAPPVGDVAGATWTWDMLAATYATWDDVLAAYASWAAVVRGPA